jgi:hypothetical protein
MNRKIQIYIEGKLLELFNDENIEVTSSVQNITDISQIFNDFSQSFTVPASTNNNRIFQHFYNSEVQGTLDFQVRRSAKIEIDLTHFRYGRIQLEKSNLKMGSVESYTITFYGSVRSLKDLIGEGLISDLDLSAYTHAYDGTQIYNRIIGTTNYDIRYPLISSERVWDYAGAVPANNINVTAGRIDYRELFPAIKVARIFDAIENDYNISFVGNYLTDGRFTNLFLWAKNSLEYNFTTVPTKFNYITTNNTTAFNITTDKLTYGYVSGLSGVPPLNSVNHKVYVTVYSVSNTSIPYYIDVYVNGALFTTVNGLGNQTYTIFNDVNVVGLSKVVEFKLRADATLSFKANTYYDLSYTYFNSGVLETGLIQSFAYASTLMTTSGNVNISQTLPEMKIMDFFRDVLKEANLTCYPLSDTVFQIEPLEDFYNKGRIIDITTYTDVDSIDVERVKLYKKIAFNREESKSFLNVKFKELNNYEYGDLSYQFPYDGDELNIKVGFENILFQQFTGTNLQVGYALESAPDYKPYTPKPVLLYLYKQTTCSAFKFYDGSAEQNINSYLPLGQDVYWNLNTWSLNFGNDISSLLLTPINNGLFNTYFFPYLNSLYNKNNRLVYVKTNLPISLLTTLKLNDRLIIRDKRYIINEMKSNLTTGVVNLVLLLDFRPVRVGRIIKVPTGGGVIKFSVPLPNGVEKAEIDVGASGITASPDTFTSDGYSDLTIPTGSNPKFIRITEDGLTRVTEDIITRRSEQGEDASYYITITYTYTNGDTEDEYILIQEEEE